VTPRLAYVLGAVLLAATVAGPPAPAGAIDPIEGTVFGSSTSLGGDGGADPSVFLVGVCEAHTNGPRPILLDITCNAYSGGPEGAGGVPSSWPSRNLAISGTGLDGSDLDPHDSLLANATPYAGRGVSMWFGSSTTPAYVCEDVVATYADAHTESSRTCTRLAA
jgi:hypothetical protein